MPIFEIDLIFRSVLFKGWYTKFKSKIIESGNTKSNRIYRIKILY